MRRTRKSKFYSRETLKACQIANQTEPDDHHRQHDHNEGWGGFIPEEPDTLPLRSDSGRSTKCHCFPFKDHAFPSIVDGSEPSPSSNFDGDYDHDDGRNDQDHVDDRIIIMMMMRVTHNS